MNKKLLAAGFALALGGVSLTAFAQSPQDNQVRQRQGVMLLQGKYFGPMAQMAAGKVPYNADVAARNAGFLHALSQMPWDAFGPDTANAQVKSRALPEVYKDASGFKSQADRLTAASAKLVAEARNEASFKATVGEIGKTCASCHDQYRSK
jgi:cytochrome c556